MALRNKGSTSHKAHPENEPPGKGAHSGAQRRQNVGRAWEGSQEQGLSVPHRPRPAVAHHRSWDSWVLCLLRASPSSPAPPNWKLHKACSHCRTSARPGSEPRGTRASALEPRPPGRQGALSEQHLPILQQGRLRSRRRKRPPEGSLPSPLSSIPGGLVEEEFRPASFFFFFGGCVCGIWKSRG